jgi:EmrB/QacA subfamily drug resistance transporter
MNHHLPLRNKIIIMVSVMASLFLVALDQTIVSTSLGKIVEEFNSFSSLSWIVTAYLLTETITVPISGKLSDMYGRRRILLAGVAIFTLSSFFAGLSSSMLDLVLWRGVQGIGGGIIAANAFTIIGDLFAARERGKWQGIFGAVFGLSSVVGPLLGGYLTDHQSIFGLVETSWRWNFWVNVPIAVVAFILIAKYCPRLKHEDKPSIDYRGVGLLSAILGLLVLGIDNTEKIFADLLSSTGLSLVGLRVIMFSAVAVLLYLFIVVEKKAKESVIDFGFFKSKNFLVLTFITLIHGAAFLGSIIYLTQFNQQVFGATPTQSGLMLLPMILGLMVSSISTGQFVSRTGKYKNIIIIGFIGMTVALALLTLLTPASSYIFEAILIFTLGLFTGTALPTLNIAVQVEFGQAKLGAATGINQLARNLGSTIGTAIFGSILTLGVASSLGDMKNDSYIESITKSPESSKFITSTSDADVLLRLNTSDAKNSINSGFQTALNSLPEANRKYVQTEFESGQKAYSSKIVDAFSKSIRQIFVLSSIFVGLAALLTFLLKERTLEKAKPTDTPGEEI